MHTSKYHSNAPSSPIGGVQMIPISVHGSIISTRQVLKIREAALQSGNLKKQARYYFIEKGDSQTAPPIPPENTFKPPKSVKNFPFSNFRTVHYCRWLQNHVHPEKQAEYVRIHLPLPQDGLSADQFFILAHLVQRLASPFILYSPEKGLTIRNLRSSDTEEFFASLDILNLAAQRVQDAHQVQEIIYSF